MNKFSDIAFWSRNVNAVKMMW